MSQDGLSGRERVAVEPKAASNKVNVGGMAACY